MKMYLSYFHFLPRDDCLEKLSSVQKKLRQFKQQKINIKCAFSGKLKKKKIAER